MTAHPTGWSVNRAAAKAVVLNAADVADARYLLEVCGLIDGPDGRAIVADDTRAVSMSLLTLPTGTRPAQSSSRRGDDEDLADADAMTSPAGLRAPPATTKKSRKKATAKKKTPLTVVEPPAPYSVEAADELVHDLAADLGVPQKPAQPPAAGPDGTGQRSGVVDLDVWFTAAQLSTSRPVQRAAQAASTALLQLLAAMDDLARAERPTASPSSRSTGEPA